MPRKSYAKPRIELDEKSPWSFEYEVKKSGRKFDVIYITPIPILKILIYLLIGKCVNDIISMR